MNLKKSKHINFFLEFIWTDVLIILSLDFSCCIFQIFPYMITFFEFQSDFFLQIIWVDCSHCAVHTRGYIVIVNSSFLIHSCDTTSKIYGFYWLIQRLNSWPLDKQYALNQWNFSLKFFWSKAPYDIQCYLY